jgi:phosphatidylethanolamine/phosphatidyl-N-methylethanolamine N-methyltransferase
MSYVKKLYSFWSIIYDPILDKIFKFDRKIVIEELKLFPPDEIIEIGVGTGLNLSYYPSYVYVTGIDFSEPMLNKAKNRKRSNINLHLSENENLEFKDNYFDKGLATFVIRMHKDPNKILKELQRIIKNEGLLVIVDTFKSSNNNFNITNFFTEILGWGENHELDKMINNTNWEIVERKKLGKSESTLIVILRNKK